MAEHYTGPQTTKFQSRDAVGSNQPDHADERHILKRQFGYTVYDKKISTAATTAVLAATTASTSAVTTVTTGFTAPDVPRALTLTIGGTGANAGIAVVVVTGTNVEGKTITESFSPTGGQAETLTGIKAFATVTRIAIPIQPGSGVTFAIGTSAKLGVNHRLYSRKTNVVVVYDTGSTTPTTPATIDTAPTVATNENVIENNLVTPTTAPNASRRYRIYYETHHWSIGDMNDQPVFSTTTSTSTSSTSTSTSSTSTSTSSTSTSTSSTSSSTSSTSTSSTSTSTTTAA